MALKINISKTFDGDSIMVNGDSLWQIYLERGLMQGDPLSPYLFILYTNGLSSLLKKSERKGEYIAWYKGV